MTPERLAEIRDLVRDVQNPSHPDWPYAQAILELLYDTSAQRSQIRDALEALAVLGRREAVLEENLARVQRHLQHSVAECKETERQLAEKDERARIISRDRDSVNAQLGRAERLLRYVADLTPGPAYSTEVDTAIKWAREALRAEPAKEEA